MSYYSSSYAGTESYNPQSDFGARPAYDTQTYPTGQYEANANANGNHGGIPGLGMPFPVGGSAQYGQPGPTSTYVAQEDTYAAPSAHVDGASQPLAQNTAAEVDDMDEGEIDEGELDDVYEPSWPQPATTVESTGPHNASAEVSQNAISPDAERGSYSPYLSPQEIQPSGFVGTSGDSMDSTKSSDPQSPAHTNLHQQRPPPSPQALADARKEAQDAVLRLWPLKVRFSDYIESGIDEEVIRELFLNLGFDPTDTSAKIIASAPDAPKPSVRDVPSAAPSPASAMGSKKESAETRKDRIARRLAAKGSDRPAPSPELPKSTSAPKPQAPLASQAKLDKSKLLQQKMEALKKARETKNATTPRSNDGAVGVASSQLMPQPQPATDPRPDDNTRPPQDDSEDQSAAAVADLAVPASTRPPAAGPPKRPMASDLNDLSDAPFKRPFGQSRQPEKFLIDVSDDEDDEAMDLDSPEMRPASVNKTNSPFKIPNFPETQFGFLGRQMSSPMATPRAPASGDDDLEAKLEDIADLKRRIAQREAEMKAKASRPASPAMSGSIAPPRATSVTLGSVALGSEVNASPLTGTPLKTKPPADFDGESQRLPKPSESRQSEGARSRSGRSGSRAASERLIAESQARRREKELKLHFMKSQILKMEREIKDSLEAEERMKAEAPDESEGELEEQQPGTAQARSTSNSAENQPSGPPLAQEADTLPSINDELRNHTATGPVEEEAIESDAAAAISSSEEAMDTVEEPSEESDGAQPSDSAKNGPQAHETEARAEDPRAQESDSPDIDTPDAAIDKTMPDVDEAQNQPAEAEDSVSSDSSSEEGNEDDEDEEELEEDEESSASPRDPAVFQTKAQDASSDSDGESESDSDSDSPDASATTPLKQPISTGQVESKPASPRERNQEPATAGGEPTGANFSPYESLLKTFRAYRFHPDFANSVPGGLRSLTYSNGIDPNLPLCPDELAGEQCPRGDDCIYQHFEKLQAPDDQILMQLGEYGNYEGEHKQEFNKGLRQILADAREKKIKDFDTLAKSIIDYRREFRKDPYKILPLGDVKL